MEKREPAQVFPPSEFIRDEMNERGWSKAQLCEAIGLPSGDVEAILNDRKRVTISVAERLGRAFGTSAVFWCNLQKAWDQQPASSLPAACERCGGDGHQCCPSCDGQGHFCIDNDHDETCKRCKGSGRAGAQSVGGNAT